MEIQLREVLSLTRRMSEIIAHHTGRPVEQVAQDIDRDHYMTAGEARDYGIIDDIILPRRGLCAPEPGAASRTPATRGGAPDLDRVPPGADPEVYPSSGPGLRPTPPCDGPGSPGAGPRSRPWPPLRITSGAARKVGDTGVREVTAP